MTNSEIIELIKIMIKSEIDGEDQKVSESYINDIKSRILVLIKSFNKKISEKDTQTLDCLYATARSEYLSVYPTYINPAVALTHTKQNIWLTEDRKNLISKNYINRYLAYLRKNGRSEKVIEEICNSSEKILGYLGDPLSNTEFWIKGLVVGNVQSGKTGNFNAVINRSIDAGYGLIIVLSGIMEDLRVQTQKRIEKEVIGESQGPVGVGLQCRFGELGDKGVTQVISITSSNSDFKRSVKEADFSLNNKNILVCKKNTGVLKNLLIWLHEHLNEKEKHNIPLLIIDDEADNASLNNLGYKGRFYASKINGHIRAILELFTKKTYLGYTATPFANVLQDRNEKSEGKWEVPYKHNGTVIVKEFRQVDNIFPDDFIVLLNSPSNYIGAKQIFETTFETSDSKIPLVSPIYDYNNSFPRLVVDEADGSVRPANENDETNKVKTRAPYRSDTFPKDLPGSLQEAIRCFILSIAVRLSRKPEMVNSVLYNPHHTMLVHISRFIPWQTKTKELIQDYVRDMKVRINNDHLTSTDSVYSELEKTWNKQYAYIVANIRGYLPEEYYDDFLSPKTFEQIKPNLSEAIDEIDVKAINSETKDKLDYTSDTARHGKKYIAIGGNRLSRGFTLEGLSINYFIRDTNFSDTLLQMGRWFGYRPGYIDMCKLFTTSDAVEKYDLITKTIEELENEFKKMERKGQTPEDFIIRVRKHPGTLKITRPSILKNTIDVKWSYQDTLEQTTSFELNATKIKNAWAALTATFKEFSTEFQVDTEESGFFRLHTDHDGLFKFLELPNTFYNFSNDIENIKAFVSLCVQQGKLKNWVIAIKKKGASEKILKSNKSGLPAPLTLTIRSGPAKDPYYREKFLKEKVFTASGKSANLVSASDLSILLSKKEIEEAQNEFKKERTEYYIKIKRLSNEAAVAKANSQSFPERIYREKIPDSTGILIIYILDSSIIFRQSDPTDSEMKDFVEKEGIDIDIPIFGYALGFPKIDPDPGGHYVRGNYDISDDESEVDEFDDELIQQED